jgi:hypothetical protein
VGSGHDAIVGDATIAVGIQGRIQGHRFEHRNPPPNRQ